MFGLLALLIAADAYCGRRDRLALERQLRRLGPDYAIAFVYPSGRGPGSTGAGLRLAPRPLVHYANLPGQRTASFSVNSRGYRGPELREPKLGRRVVVVGGSTAFGMGASSDRGTFASRLEELLGVEVVNAAVAGYSSGQELAYLATELLDLEPDLVLALDGANDFIDRRKPLMMLGGGGVFLDAWARVAQLRELTGSGLGTRLLNLHRVLAPRLGARLRRGDAGGLATPEQAADVYARNLIRMHRLARGAGSQFMALLQPAVLDPRLLPPSPGPEFGGYGAFRARARKALAGVPFADLNDPELLGRLRWHFLDPVHLRDGGQWELAREAARRIRALGLLPDAGPAPPPRRPQARPAGVY